MNKYTRMNWENTPSTATPLTADNLNHMDEGIEQATDGAIVLEAEITTARGEYANLGERLDTSDTAIAKKADRTNTLAGYGIINAYTKTEIINLLANKEDKSNKVSSKSSVTNESDNYPSIKYLNDNYYDFTELYTSDEVDEALSGKLDNTAGSVATDNIASKAVTTDKLADKSVAIAKLSDDLLNCIKTSSGTGGGKSAYDIALEHGFIGSEEDWLKSLKGADGAKGDKGEQGIKGEQGEKGQSGTDGKSAYEIALEHGFIGSEDKWLASLKGGKGDKGDKGDRGTDGKNYILTDADKTDIANIVINEYDSSIMAVLGVDENVTE